MHKRWVQLSMGVGLTFIGVQPGYALDSYRFLHVTIETPWLIFIFLLGAIFTPFILMAILVWRYTEHTTDTEDTPQDVPEEK